MSTIASKEEALTVLKEGSDIWIRCEEGGQPKIVRKEDPNETWLQMDGYFTKRQLEAILFLMDNK